MERNYDKFRINFRKLLDSHGISCKRLSQEINATPATLSRYLTGVRNPDLPYVMAISKYFNCSIDWLLGFSEDRYNALTPDLQELISLYSVASSYDRIVINTVLAKYKDTKNGNT